MCESDVYAVLYNVFMNTSDETYPKVNAITCSNNIQEILGVCMNVLYGYERVSHMYRYSD